MFNADKEIIRIVEFIKDFFSDRPFFGAVVGISGGKDSAVVATLCARAIGADRVLGVLLPNGEQADIEDSRKICKFLGIESLEINIENVVDEIERNAGRPSPFAVAPRVRMTYLYTIGAGRGLAVSCNSNLSELTVGFATKWGDNFGDFAPIAHLTKTEVVAVGKALGLPLYVVQKKPADGLTGKNDEDSFGFTYDDLDSFIRNGADSVPQVVRDKIQGFVERTEHKRVPMPVVR